MSPLSHKKPRNFKIEFYLERQICYSLNFELRYNEWTQATYIYYVIFKVGKYFSRLCVGSAALLVPLLSIVYDEWPLYFSIPKSMYNALCDQNHPKSINANLRLFSALVR